MKKILIGIITTLSLASFAGEYSLNILIKDGIQAVTGNDFIVIVESPTRGEIVRYSRTSLEGFDETISWESYGNNEIVSVTVVEEDWILNDYDAFCTVEVESYGSAKAKAKCSGFKAYIFPNTKNDIYKDALILTLEKH